MIKYVMKLVVNLFLITAGVALALAAVNTVTAPLIAQHKAEKIQAALEEVLPGALGL